MADPNNDLYLAMGRLEGKMDAVHRSLLDQKGAVDKLDERVTSLEHGKHYMLGIVAVVSVVFQLFSDKVASFFH